MKSFLKRTLSFTLALMMVLSMLPVTGEAAVYSEIIAWNDTNNNGIIDSGENTYSNLNTALNAGGTVKLTGAHLNSGEILLDYCTEEGYISMTDTVATLDLNGSLLYYNILQLYSIYLSGSASLTVTDSAGGGYWIGIAGTKAGICIRDTATLEFAGGIIDSSKNVFMASGNSDAITVTGGIYNFDPSDYFKGSYKAEKGVSQDYFDGTMFYYHVLPVSVEETVGLD